MLAPVKTAPHVFGQTRPMAERRQITVLFGDIVGYTSRAVTMDPEELALEIHEFQNLCRCIAKRYEGYIANFLGDGILILFGYPLADEFGTGKAVQAALDLLSSTRGCQNDLAVRIGISTSLVLIGEHNQNFRDELIFGEAPSLASRLQRMAEPNTALVCPRTHRLTRKYFRFRDRGHHPIKGLTDPLNLWQALKPTSARRMTLSQHHSSRFVGRVLELSQLNRLFTKSLGGEGQFVHLSGEWGIGKSRLIREFHQQNKLSACCILHFQCSPTLSGYSLAPFLIQLFHRFHLSPLYRREAETIAIWARRVPGIRNPDAVKEFVSLLRTASSRLDFLKQVTSTMDLSWVADSLIRLLLNTASRRPVILVLEDMHWADSLTTRWADCLLTRLADAPVFGIISSRPDTINLPRSTHDHAVVSMTVTRLNRQESETIIENLFSDTPLPSTVRHSLLQRTDGIPLFIESSCWELLDQMVPSDHPAMEDDLYVPESLQDMLNSRIDQLGNAKALAQLASSMGQVFASEDLRMLAEANGIEYCQGFSMLKKTQIILDMLDTFDTSDPFHGGRYRRARFSQMMLQQALHQSLSKVTRQRYHLQMIELERRRECRTLSRYGPGFVLSPAHQNLDVIALESRFSSAHAAINRLEYHYALDHLTRGLFLIGRCPERHHRQEWLAQFASTIQYISEQSLDGPDRDVFSRANELLCALDYFRRNPSPAGLSLMGFWRYLINQSGISDRADRDNQDSGLFRYGRK